MKEDITIKASDCINLDKNDKNETMIGKSIFIPQYGINMDDFHKYLDVKGLNATTNIEDLCIDWDDKYADELGPYAIELKIVAVWKKKVTVEKMQ